MLVLIATISASKDSIDDMLAAIPSLILSCTMVIHSGFFLDEGSPVVRLPEARAQKQDSYTRQLTKYDAATSSFSFLLQFGSIVRCDHE